MLRYDALVLFDTWYRDSAPFTKKLCGVAVLGVHILRNEVLSKIILQEQ